MTEHPDFEEDQPVYILYPLPDDNLNDRTSWHWLPGYIIVATTDPHGQPEYCAVVEDDRLEEPGPEGQPTFPIAFRDPTEIRPREDSDQ